MSLQLISSNVLRGDPFIIVTAQISHRSESIEKSKIGYHLWSQELETYIPGVSSDPVEEKFEIGLQGALLSNLQLQIFWWDTL